MISFFSNLALDAFNLIAESIVSLGMLGIAAVVRVVGIACFVSTTWDCNNFSFKADTSLIDLVVNLFAANNL